MNETLSNGSDYNATTVAAAVKTDGAIGVCWYDRRGLQPVRLVPRDDGLQVKGTDVLEPIKEGWNVRMRVSTDGGTTWYPSVQLNDMSGEGAMSVRHTLGLAASPNGEFHAVWIDNRTGEREIWTCKISLE